MAEVIVVEDRLDVQCVRHLHLMANEVIGRNVLRPYGIPATTAKIERGEVAGSHFVRAEWMYHGVWDVNAACAEGKFRRLVVWNLEGYEHVREAVNHAAIYFHALFGGVPQFGFLRKLPKGIENGREVALTLPSPEGRGASVMLLEAEWMLERSVAVGGRRTPPPTPPQIDVHNLERGE